MQPVKIRPEKTAAVQRNGGGSDGGNAGSSGLVE